MEKVILNKIEKILINYFENTDVQLSTNDFFKVIELLLKVIEIKQSMIK